jgi:hypothetical protein
MNSVAPDWFWFWFGLLVVVVVVRALAVPSLGILCALSSLGHHTIFTSLSARKRRRAITDVEKKAIRDWWTAALPEQRNHKKLRTWFLETHYHSISQSFIFEILSDRYQRLDKSATVEFTDKKINH